MIEQLIIISVILYLIIGSVNDVRSRFVHDYTTYTFGLLFLLLRIMLAFETGNPNDFFGIFAYVLPVLAASFLLYKIGWWGGGDAKIVTALSIGAPFLSTDTVLPFFANFIANSLVGGLLFGLAYLLVLSIIKRKAVSKVLNVYDLLIMVALFAVSVYLFFQNVLYKLFSLVLFLLPVSYLIRKIEPVIQMVEKNVKSLEPGDWIPENIKVGKKTVFKKLTGLSKEDIQLLQKYHLKKIVIKDGLPFVPSFLLGFILTLLYGNVLLTILQNTLLTSI